MPAATFESIKQKLGIKDHNLYFYSISPDGAITLRQVSEYELLAQEGLRDIYDKEPEGLWETCLEDSATLYCFGSFSLFRCSNN